MAGGMGVIMLGLLIFSRSVGGGGMSLARAELTGPTVSPTGLTFQSTARILWMVFVALTLIEFVLLVRFTHSRCLRGHQHLSHYHSHRGMTPTDGGIGGFDSVTLESILIFFMFVSGLNFAALYLIAVKGQFNEIKDEEMRNYAILWVSTIAIVSTFLAYEGLSFDESVRDAAFTITSIITSTGYSTADWGSWQLFPKLIILILMAIGAHGRIDERWSEGYEGYNALEDSKEGDNDDYAAKASRPYPLERGRCGRATRQLGPRDDQCMDPALCLLHTVDLHNRPWDRLGVRNLCCVLHAGQHGPCPWLIWPFLHICWDVRPRVDWILGFDVAG